MGKNQESKSLPLDEQEQEIQLPVSPATTQPAYKSIEEMRQLRQTSAAIHEGACFANGWRSGKMVTESEYDTAVESFSSAPMGAHSATKQGGDNNAS